MIGDSDAEDGLGAEATGLYLESLHGNWAWKPERDRTLGDGMVTFRGVPCGAPELMGTERGMPR